MNAINSSSAVRSRRRIAAVAVVVLAGVGASPATADDELAKRASWSQPVPEAVKAQLDEWLATQDVDEPTRAQIEQVWLSGDQPWKVAGVLGQVAETVALVDERARELVTACHQDHVGVLPPSFEILADEDLAPVARNNLKLVAARWYAQQGLYDETLEQIGELTTDDVADPAALLFYQSIAQHWLMDKEKCLPTIARLFENRDSIPRRYVAMAELMEADLKPLKEDSLDEVARLMDDIRRRLDLARAGKTVRKQEDDVIAKLDKMIEELEKKRKQQQQQAAAGGNNPSQPMPDSMPGGGSGPGNVDPKRIGSRSGWGDLPPKERQEALQQVGRDFPSHYREVIEEYFRKLAKDASDR
jgi:hypothetical protein